MTQLSAVMSAIAARRYSFTTELLLQDQVEDALTASGLPFEREFILSPEERIDFVVGTSAPWFGVEVKIKGSTADLVRQLDRYARLEAIGALIVVTSRMRLTDIPESLNGISVQTLFVGGRL